MSWIGSAVLTPPATVMPNCATAVGEVVRLADEARELLKLLDEPRIGGRGAAGAADGQEQAVVVDQAAAAEDAARVQLEVVDLVADGAPVEDALVAGVAPAEGTV